MPLQDKIKFVLKKGKILSYWVGGIIFIGYHLQRTYISIDKIVNTQVLDREKKCTPEYIYIDDPLYSDAIKKEEDRQNRTSMGLLRLVKSLKHSLAWRLLWLCRHGNTVQRNIALEQLAGFKNNKHWDCLKLAQAMDKNTAVLLARTRGADLRYFLPPPLHVRWAAKSPQFLSYKLKEMIVAVQGIHPHSCIEHFLSKYFVNDQEQNMEADSIPTKPDSINEHDLCLLCLDALHHHISLYYEKDYMDDKSSIKLISMGLLANLAEVLLRYPDDSELDFAVLRILTVLSIHSVLLQDFFVNGIIGELSRLIRSKDVRLASSAAVCLANLSGECLFRPGLYLLHPLYRTRTPHACDTLLVHGLRGGVFVTWRQRDTKCAQPLGIIEATTANFDCESCEDKTSSVNPYIDPDMKEVLEDLEVLEEQALLTDYEVVLHDLPIETRRDEAEMKDTALHKCAALAEENEDHCHYTFCWPRDWLPRDCGNLRILGVNYWSSLSEWLDRCPLQSADISERAAELAPSLITAGVGKKDVPVVWLAHSMGGLIVKQVLKEAAIAEEASVHKLCENTKAVIFFSTPHKGSAFATMPRPAAAILWPSTDVRQLQENSPDLLDLHETFLKYADHYSWETISFAETLPTLVTAFKVPVHFVKANSADPGTGVFYQLPLDHLAICKPATRQSIVYRTVLDVLNRVTLNDEELKYRNPFWNLIIHFLSWLFSVKDFDIIDTAQENNNEGLKWFEQFLLNTFTDF